jgi:hypothetical protein
MKKPWAELSDREKREKIVRYLFLTMAGTSAIYGAIILWDIFTLISGVSSFSWGKIIIPDGLLLYTWYTSLFGYHFLNQYNRWSNDFNKAEDDKDARQFGILLLSAMSVFFISLFMPTSGQLATLSKIMYTSAVACAPIIMGLMVCHILRAGNDTKILADVRLLREELANDRNFRNALLRDVRVYDVFAEQVYSHINKYGFVTPSICAEQFDLNKNSALALLEEMEDHRVIYVDDYVDKEPKFKVVHYRLSDSYRQKLKQEEEEKKKKNKDTPESD